MPTKYEGPNKTKGKIDRDDDSNVLDPKDLDDAANAGAEAKVTTRTRRRARPRATTRPRRNAPNRRSR